MTNTETVLWAAIREADAAFKKDGGSGSKTWMRDYFQPSLTKRGLMIVSAKDVALEGLKVMMSTDTEPKPTPDPSPTPRGYVAVSVYESAVKGRQDFRRAMVAARADCDVLREALHIAVTGWRSGEQLHEAEKGCDGCDKIWTALALATRPAGAAPPEPYTVAQLEAMNTMQLSEALRQVSQERDELLGQLEAAHDLNGDDLALIRAAAQRHEPRLHAVADKLKTSLGVASRVVTGKGEGT